MKKLGTLLLALAMILAMSVTTFADSDDPKAKVTFDDSGRTYSAYRLLTLESSRICTCEEGTAHTEDCYGYIYSVNSKYKTILQELAGEKDILDYLSGLTSDKTDEYYGTLREEADQIYRAIQAENMEADAVLSGSATFKLDQGYWLFADSTKLNGANDATSLVMVNTVGLEELTISPKVSLPTVEKKVRDINDSEDGDISDNNWQDSADYDINDKVYFKLTATLPDDVEYYKSDNNKSYALYFHDTLSAGLTLDEGSIEVFADGKKVLNSINSETEVPNSFNSKTSPSGDIKIGCSNIFDIQDIQDQDLTVTKDTVFEVYYTATLNKNAVIGAEGNPNEVYLEFSNDPYSGTTGETEVDKVIVFTYQLTIKKFDDKGNELKGAGFKLYKKDVDGDYELIGSELTGDNMTTFKWRGLDDGAYKLEESTVPAGYNKMNDIEFTISAEHDEEADEPTLISTLGEADFESGIITEEIVNNAGAILPKTGAKGTMMLILCSCMFVMVAAVFMITRKKMSIYED